jgi:hypothetical protein
MFAEIINFYTCYCGLKASVGRKYHSPLKHSSCLFVAHK